MNLKNYHYLTESLEKLGFGEALNNALKTKMELGFDEIELKAKTKFAADEMAYSLKFSKGKTDVQGERFYFLNKIKATLTKQNEQPMEQEFALYKQRGYNAKEMFNLMDKRPVYKIFRREGENVGRWVKLDFSNKDENGNALARPYYDNVTNFNLSREVGKLNLTFVDQKEKEQLLRDLQNGDRVSVTIRQNGMNEKAYLAVAPQIGGLVLYNTEMKEIKRTNTNNIELVPDEKEPKVNTVIDKGNAAELPDATRKLVDKANHPDQKEGPKRKVS
ncbi:MAG: hypothetical protein WCF67_01025 [Chitinophagaceae bacterium]